MIRALTVPQAPTHPGLTPDTPPVYEEGIPLPDPIPRPASPPPDWRTATMPPAVRNRPRDHRGYPVFFVVEPRGGVPGDGRVDFRVLQLDRYTACAREHRCGVCGKSLHRLMWFIGGPMCVQNRVFGDAPMHEACARYALLVCPHLRNPAHHYSKAPAPGTEGDPNVILRKPERIVLYACVDYTLTPTQEGKPVLIVAPARVVEWYTTAGEYLARTRPTRYSQ